MLAICHPSTVIVATEPLMSHKKLAIALATLPRLMVTALPPYLQMS
jgi:hypothetical protein